MLREWKELKPVNDGAASFYKKAWVSDFGNTHILKSYDTEILAVEDLPNGKHWIYPIMDKDLYVNSGTYYRYPRDISAFSNTTVRHIKDFLYQYAGICGLSTKEIKQLIWENEEPYIR